ncbi:DoxX family protein [cf. Phormidesmis sp. LEGE 11477]|uniref:DoxX family protein n=1 Tax=cf. Phormidesmis sp. LEGE 11477 TaxID=1828680 RepID=UPI001881AE74|nr:DoxX family protein [cf. Phormidesmis sp. LEGE 11477]MBE9063889.1 DoxX family protein [cf. Phormidesmis sp. LEGE 11477]
MLIQKYMPLIARTFLAVIFINSGIGKLSNFSGTQQQIASAGLPLAAIVTVFTIAFQLLGGAALIVGYKAKIGSTLLLLFLVPATLVFHNPLVDPTQMTQFLKNLAIIGGLLMVTAYGSGPVSLDRSDDHLSAVHRSEESIR